MNGDQLFKNCCWEIASDEMLPSVPAGAAPQQFPALPACVEEVNFDLLQAEGSLQVEDVKDAYTQQQLKEVLSSPEFRAFLETIELDSDIQLTSAAAPPGLQQLEFENVKMPSSDQNRLRKSNNASPVIPLSVQQEQLDSIDPQAIAQSDWLQTDDTQFSYLLIPDEEVDAAAAAAAAGQPMPTERLGSSQTSPPPEQTADQTVPFRRHDSVCSALSACSDVVVRNERRSISDTESTISPPFTPSASQPHSTSSSSRRRGRPCFDNASDGDTTLPEKKRRRREQNRRAATRCRNKRRTEFEQLKKDHEVVMGENDQLKQQLIQLTTRAEQLRNELIRHRQYCGLTLPLNVSIL